MGDVPRSISDNEAESSFSVVSHNEEKQSDESLNFEPVCDYESAEKQKQGSIVEEKSLELEPANGGKLVDVDDSSVNKPTEKREDPDGACVRKSKIVTFEAEDKMISVDQHKIVAENSNSKPAGKFSDKFDFLSKFTKKSEDSSGKLSTKPEDPDGKHAEKSEDSAVAIKAGVDTSEADEQMSADDSKKAKIAVENLDIDSNVVASKHGFKAAPGDPEGASKKSPKAKSSKAKESPKRLSTLSANSFEDGKVGGCFSAISPKRIYGLFKNKSPKLKVGSSLGAAFSPIGYGKHFEVVYLGQCFPDEYERVERIDYTNMAEEKIIPTFLGSRPCYDVMPTSGKVVVFSVELLVKNAFSALVSNEIKAAPLWDAGIMDFVGMLTISDFINVLKCYFSTKPEDMKDIENQSIATWRRMTGVPKKFVKINGQDSLSLAAKLLIQERIHRIPVFDEKRQCVLFVLTKKRLLQFLSQGLLEKFDKTNVRTPSFFKKTIRELKIGTFEDIAVVTKETKLIEALGIFVSRNVSALPVLDKNDALVDLFEKFDVFGLAKDQTYHNLEMTVEEVIKKPYARETAWICTMDDTLQSVIDKFVARKVHRLVVIDGRFGVAGMISLSDVLKFLVVQPLALMESASVSDTILEGSEGAVGGAEDESDCPVHTDLSTGVAHMKIESSESPDEPQEDEPAADD